MLLSYRKNILAYTPNTSRAVKLAQ